MLEVVTYVGHADARGEEGERSGVVSAVSDEDPAFELAFDLDAEHLEDRSPHPLGLVPAARCGVGMHRGDRARGAVTLDDGNEGLDVATRERLFFVSVYFVGKLLMAKPYTDAERPTALYPVASEEEAMEGAAD